MFRNICYTSLEMNSASSPVENRLMLSIQFSIGSQQTDKLSTLTTRLATIIVENILRREAHKLIQIPSTDLHVALILIQALGKTLRVRLAAPRSPAIPLISRIIRLAGHGTVGLLGFGRSTAGSSAKEATNGMADRRADRDASGGTRHLAEQTGALSSLSWTFGLLGGCWWVGGGACAAI